MYYKIIDPREVRELITSLSSLSSASCLKNANGSYVSEELEQSIKTGCFVVADKRPSKVKIYFNDEAGLKRFCVLPDCNTRALMSGVQEDHLQDILYCSLGKRVELEKISVFEEKKDKIPQTV